MSEKSNREIMDRYTRAVIERDLDMQDKASPRGLRR